MNCVLISGLWPTEDHNGLTDLALKIASQLPGTPCRVYRYDDKNIPDADILIGFSLGGERAVKIASKMKTEVRYMALIDPVVNWVPWFWRPWFNFKISPNVTIADCFKRRLRGIPPSSLILNDHPYYYRNHAVDTGHADAPRNQYTIDIILAQVKSLSVNG